MKEDQATARQPKLEAQEWDDYLWSITHYYRCDAGHPDRLVRSGLERPLTFAFYDLARSRS